MSADNFIAIWNSQDSLGRDRWYVSHGMMPSIEDGREAEWKKSREGHVKPHLTKESALVAAYDMYEKETIVEYGIISL